MAAGQREVSTNLGPARLAHLIGLCSAYAAVKGSMRTTARAPTALAKRWTVRMDGVPLPL